MILKNKNVLLLVSILLLSYDVYTQTLNVMLSPDDKKVNRNTNNGVATIIIDSKVKGLSVDNGTDDQWMNPSEDMFVYLVDTKKDLERGYELSQRCFVLNSPKSSEYLLEIDEILPNQVLYYTVMLSEQYTRNLILEYIFSKTSMCGFRVSYGKRMGLYLSYQSGKYNKTGNDISKVKKDYDITMAKELGYIKTNITAGLRMGVLHKDRMNLYVLLGCGYGEYGRQWENLTEIDGNIFFYSDYIKGFGGELACQYVMNDLVCLSLGTDLVVGKGKISVDYQIGVGLNFDLDRLFRNKNVAK
ncbi:MAG: hypothetical protein IKW51_10205 [Bacteroidales bacterium]|nr:hypothetical protein [Bacteroidales bacterium]